ncbi:hypothetical protein ACFTAO_11780 [Paenibacillus rhizoplanae]
MIIRPGCGQDIGAVLLGHLHRKMSHASSACVNKNPLAGMQLAVLE